MLRKLAAEGKPQAVTKLKDLKLDLQKRAEKGD